ncbi:MAG: methyltransferase domain-containing protein [Cytophagales bacterium]|nr:methyltransferase domain-containing protein [Armatimonadota bacterium]
MNVQTLPAEAFRRYDETPDSDFYQIPRLVTHIDDSAIAAVTQLYREQFPPTARVLDLMSSWVSHLPSEIPYPKVVGLGMNARELAANPRLSEWVVQSLNANSTLPFPDAAFDACGICVSIQYLTDPVSVLREVGRVLTPGSPIVITFSNRCFPTKAVAVWQQLSDQNHLKLVAHYLHEAGEWDEITLLDRSPRQGKGDPLFAVTARRA